MNTEEPDATRPPPTADDSAGTSTDDGVTLPPLSDPADFAHRPGCLERAAKTGCVLTLLAVLLAGAVVLGYVWTGYSRVNSPRGPAAKPVTVTIAQGDGYSKVLQRLHDGKVLGGVAGLDDRWLMRYLAWNHGNSAKIRHGAYRLDPSASLSDLYGKLVEGGKGQRFTVPEGMAVPQVAALAARKIEGFDAGRFVALASDKAFVDGLALDVDADSLEGYLWPGTYDVGDGIAEEELLRAMAKAFTETVSAKLAAMPGAEDGMTTHQHVIMASLVEREARVDEDRPLIAGVIRNRMAKGMRLQIDATVNYALGEWRRLTYADYKFDSPYNTYKINGLPPGPICSPRLSSLLATYRPASHDFLFYVHKGDGHHAFATTYEEHERNVRRYVQGLGAAAADGTASAPTTAAADDGTSFVRDAVTTGVYVPPVAVATPPPRKPAKPAKPAPKKPAKPTPRR